MILGLAKNIRRYRKINCPREKRTTIVFENLYNHKLEELAEKDMVWFEELYACMKVNNLINFILAYHCFYYKF